MNLAKLLKFFNFYIKSMEKTTERLNILHKKSYFLNYIIFLVIIFFILSVILFPCKVFAQDYFAGKFYIDKATLASLATLINNEDFITIKEPIISFKKSNQKYFDDLCKIIKNNKDEELTFQKTFDSSYILSSFKIYYEIFQSLDLRKYNFFLNDFASLLLSKDQTLTALEKFFKDKAKENFYFFNLPFSIDSYDPVIFHINRVDLGFNTFLCFETKKTTDKLFTLLYTLYSDRLLYTTLLPKTLTLSKASQKNYFSLTFRPFIYPEVESFLEDTFVIYNISKNLESFEKYTGISLSDYIESRTFFYKNTWINELIKSWDSMESSSFFNFPKPYGQKFLDLISEEKSTGSSYNQPLSKILELNDNVICIVKIADGLKLSANKLSLIEKKLKNSGFSNVVTSFDYERNIFEYMNFKKIFISFSTKDFIDQEVFSITHDKNKGIIIQDTLVPEFTEISAISYFDRVDCAIILKNPSKDSILTGLNNLFKMENNLLVLHRNFFKILFDKIITFFAPLSL
ncbi:MAG TPA: hypothetical protein PK044_07070 [Exilispira sp.]|nr:hypothetical protein [Exilispira sp.]